MEAALELARAHLDSAASTDFQVTRRIADELEKEAARSNAALPTHLAELPAELLLILATLLDIPQACVDDLENLEADDILLRERFNQRVPSLLNLASALSRLLPRPPNDSSASDITLRARLLLCYGRFSRVQLGQSYLTDAVARQASTIIAALISESYRRALIREMLSVALPPFFKAHPKVSPETGRARDRPTPIEGYDGDDGDRRGWRGQPGLGNVINVIISAIEPQETEDLWHLLLPPLLAYLDDWDPPQKFVGVHLLDALLPKIDRSLLTRTGVGKIFEASLTSCLSSLSSPLSPALFLSASQTSISLLDVLYPAPTKLDTESTRTSPPNELEKSQSLAHHEALAALMHASLLHLWSFRAGSTAYEIVGLTVLSPLVSRMGLMTARFLPAIVPHLCLLIEHDAELGVGSTRLGIDAAKELVGVLRAVDQSRRKRWAGRIIAAVGKSWLALNRIEDVKSTGRAVSGDASATEALRFEARSAIHNLLDALGSKEFVDRLTRLDPVFEGLLEDSTKAVAQRSAAVVDCH